jgi:hypothetical protein
MTFAAAASLAFAADTVSIIVMEIMDNAVMLLIPGAMDAGVTDMLFWVSLALSFVAGLCGDRAGESLAHRAGARPRGGPCPSLMQGIP